MANEPGKSVTLQRVQVHPHPWLWGQPLTRCPCAPQVGALIGADGGFQLLAQRESYVPLSSATLHHPKW